MTPSAGEPSGHLAQLREDGQRVAQVLGAELDVVARTVQEDVGAGPPWLEEPLVVVEGLTAVGGHGEAQPRQGHGRRLGRVAKLEGQLGPARVGFSRLWARGPSGPIRRSCVGAPSPSSSRRPTTGPSCARPSVCLAFRPLAPPSDAVLLPARALRASATETGSFAEARLRVFPPVALAASRSGLFLTRPLPRAAATLASRMAMRSVSLLVSATGAGASTGWPSTLASMTDRSASRYSSW